MRYLHCLAQFNLALIGLFLATDHAKKRGFTCPVGPNNTYNGARRDTETQVINQQTIIIAFADIGKLDDLIAQALGHRNKDLLRLVTALILIRRQLFEAIQTRFRLGLTPLGVLTHPFQLFADSALARAFGGLFLGQAIFFLLEPGTVVALPRNTMTAV